MTRVAVICGTGMSELTNDFRKKPDSKVSELRIQSKWGEVPIFVIFVVFSEMFTSPAITPSCTITFPCIELLQFGQNFQVAWTSLPHS